MNITSAYRRIYPEANYTGHDWDDVLGMYYAKARFYDPAAKRFVSMDPVKGNVVDPLSLVSYLYCVDNPLKYVDLDGRDPVRARQKTVTPAKLGTDILSGQKKISGAPSATNNLPKTSPATVSTPKVTKNISHSFKDIPQNGVKKHISHFVDTTTTIIDNVGLIDAIPIIPTLAKIEVMGYAGNVAMDVSYSVKRKIDELDEAIFGGPPNVGSWAYNAFYSNDIRAYGMRTPAEWAALGAAADPWIAKQQLKIGVKGTPLIIIAGGTVALVEGAAAALPGVLSGLAGSLPSGGGAALVGGGVMADASTLWLLSALGIAVAPALAEGPNPMDPLVNYIKDKIDGLVSYFEDLGCEGAKRAPQDRDLGQYSFKDGIDEDLRGSGTTFDEALDKAFEKTGVPKEDFSVTKWGRDQYGKSHPVEWRSPDGAEVSIDIGHPYSSGAPTSDHIGWQTAGKRSSGGGVRGHIFVDSVPYNR